MTSKVTIIHKVNSDAERCDYCAASAILTVEQDHFPNNICTIHLAQLTKGDSHD